MWLVLCQNQTQEVSNSSSLCQSVSIKDLHCNTLLYIIKVVILYSVFFLSVYFQLLYQWIHLPLMALLNSQPLLLPHQPLMALLNTQPLLQPHQPPITKLSCDSSVFSDPSLRCLMQINQLWKLLISGVCLRMGFYVKLHMLL